MTARGLTRPDNRISFTDQVMFLAMRATGQESVMQGVWVYEHPVDFDGLRRFHRNLGNGVVGRRIEPSPLPFGRHRWVADVGPRPDMKIAETPRPRAELSDWVDEQAQLPIDPEWGPTWSMGVLPLTDGSTAVSMVASHCVADGVGALAAIIDAATGNIRDFGYPPPHSRSRLRTAALDGRQTVQDLPEVASALGKGIRQAFRRRHDFARSSESRPIRSDGADCVVAVPSVSIYVDLGDWDARAEALGGNSYSLVAGFAAKLAERVGRRRAADGAVTLNIPVSERTLDDTRANAVALFNISLDPTVVAKDLSGTRAALRQAVKTAREVPDEALELLPLIPFVPKRAVRKLADVLFGFSADLPVSCSNVGDLPPEIACVDGTPAEYVALRGVDRRITQRTLEERCGLLTLVVGRVVGKMSISIVAYEPGGINTKAHLRELAAQTLAEFELTGVID
ncbi:wax ester/triacylglycerol synthase domain-containing protein [Mycobacterium conspicuum]|nr:wax ester/triacylglycerol synthase domain-containing protein [Mycobacterium conspicuum]ORV42613.1 hypothetical protein AWC00_11575 [Mycobacterium conspicuum]